MLDLAVKVTVTFLLSVGEETVQGLPCECKAVLLECILSVQVVSVLSHQM